MATPDAFTDGDFTLPVRTGRARISRPFSGEGDNETRVVELDFIQYADSFFPDYLGRMLRSNEFNWHDFPVAYLVSESALEPVGYNLVKFTRTFAEIPKRRYYGESYSWRRPGFAAGGTAVKKTISGFSSGGGATLLTATGHGFVGTQIILVNMSAIDNYGRRITQNLEATATVVDANTLSIPIQVSEADYIGQQWNFLLKGAINRPEETIEVASTVEIDYFLPGVSSNIATEMDIPIIRRAVIYSSANEETNTLDAASKPTQDDYLNDVTNGVMRCVVSSSLTRWMGNIWQRSTRYVRTQ